ncbi:hypothetical protein AS850_11520 [Frondihabitans sp. 762G35]|nr:hypothetical protein AS850_11520 [Frondihabitans sp. 762G35]
MQQKNDRKKGGSRLPEKDSRHRRISGVINILIRSPGDRQHSSEKYSPVGAARAQAATLASKRIGRWSDLPCGSDSTLAILMPMVVAKSKWPLKPERA